MNRMTEVSESVRTSWCSEVQNVCQGVVGTFLDGDPATVQEAAARLTRDLPTPQSLAESVFLRMSLVSFLDRSARTLHDRFHKVFGPQRCHYEPPLETTERWTGPHSMLDRSLDAWSRDFASWFDRHHDTPPALRALRYLDRLGAKPYSLGAMAREAGLGRTAVVEQVRALTGLAPSEYAARGRLRGVMRQVRASKMPIEEVAREGGYRSENKFYTRVREYTGLAPSEIRALSDDAFERLLLEKLPMRSRDGMSRISSLFTN